MKRWIGIALVAALAAMVAACGGSRDPQGGSDRPGTAAFNPETLKIPDQGGRKIRGQLLYMPIYSNIPYQEDKSYDLSAFLAVHNTDLKNPIRITKVDYFNTDGQIVRSFISGDRQLGPLATAIFTVSKQDKSGVGANFLVEWMADQPVSEPLVESIMKDLAGNLGLSFLSQGRVIREMP
jgi:hypothetical protein